MSNKINLVRAVMMLAVLAGVFAPSAALAATGTVTAVRSCYDTATTRVVAFQLDGNKWYYGIDNGVGTSSIASIVTAALLSGRSVKVANATGAIRVCGALSDPESKLAFPIHNTAAYFVEML